MGGCCELGARSLVQTEFERKADLSSFNTGNLMNHSERSRFRPRRDRLSRLFLMWLHKSAYHRRPCDSYYLFWRLPHLLRYPFHRPKRLMHLLARQHRRLQPPNINTPKKLLLNRLRLQQMRPHPRAQVLPNLIVNRKKRRQPRQVLLQL